MHYHVYHTHIISLVVLDGPPYQMPFIDQENIEITISPLSKELVILSTKVIIACCVECFCLKPY